MGSPLPIPETTGRAAWAVLEPIREEMEQVEERCREDGIAGVPQITEIGQYLRASGGKRLRPALVLLTAHLCGAPGPGAIGLAAVVEMIHAATLIHDDIIDGAATRRGRPSAHFRWGAHTCVLAGDWLYMQAFKLALRERNLAILDELIALTQAMVEGELLQQEMLGRVIGIAEHMDLLERKTARLFRTSCQLGALLAARDAATSDCLARYGHHLGLAFQIADDILDLTSTEAILGKPVGSDLREGKMTLACLHAYAAANTEERGWFARVMRDASYEGVALAQIQDLLRRTGSLERARRESREHAQAARAALEIFPPSIYRDALLQMPGLVVERDV